MKKSKIKNWINLIFFVSIFILLFNLNGITQLNFDWVHKYNYKYDDYGRSITIDDSNYVYFAGHSGPSYNGTDGSFIGKMDSTQLVWDYFPKQFPSSDVTPRKITCDSSGYIYLLFELIGSVVFGNDTITSSDGLHLVKLQDSVLIWHIELPGDNGSDPLYELITTKEGSTYVMSQFGGTVNVGSFTITSVGNTDVYIAKILTNGSVKWVNRYGHTNSSRGDVVKGLSLDLFENVYGYFSYAYSTAGGDAGSYVLKLDSSGTFFSQTEVTAIGGYGYFEIKSFTTSRSGNCFIVCNIDSQPAAFRDTTLNLNDGGVVLLVYDNAMNLKRCKVLMDTVDAYLLNSASIKINAFDDVFIGGRCWQAFVIESIDSLTPGFFILSYDSLLNLKWTKDFALDQGSNVFAQLHELDLKNDNLVFIGHNTGMIDPVIFDSVSVYTIWQDVFVGSLDLRDTTLITEIATLNSVISPIVFPNPTNDYVNIDLDKLSKNSVNSEIILRSFDGKVVYTNRITNNRNLRIDLSNYAAGMYLLSIRLHDQYCCYKISKH